MKMSHRDERLMDFRQWLRSVTKFLHLILWSSWTLCSDDAVTHTRVGFTCFMGTFHRHNDFYTACTNCILYPFTI